MHAADIQDRDGGELVMATMFGMFPFLLKLYADGGYQGPLFRAALKKIMAQVNVEIVKRSGQAKTFVVLPRRWVVERTFAWLGRCRRLAKDWENLNRKGLSLESLRNLSLCSGEKGEANSNSTGDFKKRAVATARRGFKLRLK